MSKEWPTPSAPSHPAPFGFYFGRMIGNAVQNVQYHNFMNKWQVGVFLHEVLEEGELLEVVDREQGEDRREPESQFTYLIVTERDAQGEPMKARTYWGRLVGLTHAEAVKAADSKGSIELPYGEKMWVNAARGNGFTLRFLEPTKAGPLSADTSKPRREPRESKEPRAARPRGDDVISLQELCAEHKVEPKDVRNLLRKRNVEKPEGGWVWPKGADCLPNIVDIILAAKRGEKK